MTDLRLTPAAMKALYAAQCAVVMSRDTAAKHGSHVPSSVQILALDDTGVISLPDEAESNISARQPFAGLPAGLMGFAVKPQHETIARDFLSYAERQLPPSMPHIHIVKGFRQPLALSKAINEMLAERMALQAKGAAATQHQLAAIRAINERNKTALNRATRIINGIGYNTRAIVYDLPAGDDTLAQPDDSSSYGYAQELPVGLAGLSAISLYISGLSATPKDNVDGHSSSGEVLVVVRRAADQKPVFTTTISYADLNEGWHRFALPEPVTTVDGECELHLSWSGAGGPAFALTSLKADRFGDADGMALAVRIEKSIASVADKNTIHASDNFSAVNGDAVAYAHISGADMFARSMFYGGSALETEINERNGWPALSADGQQGWLQTHVLSEDICGVHLPHGLGAHVSSVRASVHLAHAKAAPCIAFLVAAEPDMATKVETQALLKQLGSGASLDRCGNENGVCWSATVLQAGESSELSLELDGEQTHDLMLLTKPLIEGKADFGWCRWNRLSIGYKPGDTVDVQTAPARTSDMNRFMRVVSFPEIADRIEFYRGRYQHNKLRLGLGFMPVQMHNEFGAMQTNPLKDQLCAAELVGGLPEGAVRIVCDVGTAHAQASRFTYITGVISYNNEDRVLMIENIAKRVENGEPTGDENGAVWNSVTLPALAKQSLSVDIPASIRAGDIPFFCAVPAEGNTTFGWCRWYSLAIETQIAGSQSSS